MTWRERDHPRDGRGRFTDGGGWAAEVSDRMSAAPLGPQGEFDSWVIWRVFPSSLAPGLIPDDDPHDATQQVRRSESEWGGLGRWWWADPHEQEQVDVGFYGGPGSVLVGARARAAESNLRDRSGHSGQFAFEPVELAVVAMQVWEGRGWRPIPVPGGLTTVTHGAGGS
jgi:hypothetical protein